MLVDMRPAKFVDAPAMMRLQIGNKDWRAVIAKSRINANAHRGITGIGLGFMNTARVKDNHIALLKI